jgi:hypothetical protein
LHAAGRALIVGVAVSASLVSASLVSAPSVNLGNLVSAPSVNAKGNAVAVAVATSASSEPASANAVIARHALLTCTRRAA